MPAIETIRQASILAHASSIDMTCVTFQTLIAQPAVEGLYVAVLRRLSRVNEVELHPALIGPGACSSWLPLVEDSVVGNGEDQHVSAVWRWRCGANAV